MVAFTAWRRPHYLRETLDSWREVRGVDDVELHLMLEPSDRLAEMVAVIRQSDLVINTHLNPARLGVARNPWHALETVFVLGAEFAILAEEDIVVSDDVLEWFGHARQIHKHNEQVLGICAYTEREQGRPEATLLSDQFAVLLWGTGATNWCTTLRDAWDQDYTTHGGRPGHESGWDWEMTRLARRTGQMWVHPEVSRSRHIGELEGVHTSSATWEAEHCPTFRAHRPPIGSDSGDDTLN
jgi:hypothetical protein